MSRKYLGNYKFFKFPKARIPTPDFLAMGDKYHYVKSLIEIDVTEGRHYITTHESKTGVKLSFTAWLLKCIGKAVNEHQAVHSMLMGKKKSFSLMMLIFR